jgi:hypothetical protein
MEGAPKLSQSKESPAKPEEELLAHFRTACETESGTEMNHEIRVHTYHSFHEDLDHLEEAPMVDQYERGMIPTIDSLTAAARSASDSLEVDPEDAEAVRIGKLLRGQAGSIRTWCRRYVGTIIKFHTMKMRSKLQIANAGACMNRCFLVFVLLIRCLKRGRSTQNSNHRSCGRKDRCLKQDQRIAMQ